MSMIATTKIDIPIYQFYLFNQCYFKSGVS